MESIFKVLAEFFRSVKDEKAHWYRVFNPADDKMDCTIMKSTFPSLTTLMLMDESYMIELFLHLGFMKRRIDRNADTSFIHAIILGITSLRNSSLIWSWRWLNYKIRRTV
jgi:hypothetical protein